MGPEERQYQVVFDHSREGIFVTSGDGQFVQVNPGMVDLLGYLRLELLARNVQDLFSDPGDWDRLREEIEREGRARAFEARLRRKDGRELDCHVSAAAEHTPDGSVAGHHGLVSPIGERPAPDEQIQRATLHDTLTQLPNRTFFVQRLERLLQRHLYRPAYRFGLLFVALNRFKLVNDSLGHRAGDRLLVLVAERLSNLVRPEDTVARIAGDEFGILMMDLDGGEEAAVVAGRIREGLGEPFDVFGEDVYVSASIGITLSEPTYGSAEDMLRDAETAADHAKREGLEGGLVFEDSMRTGSVTRFATEMALRRAVERQEFVLHYQPVVALESRRIVGFEALARWNHPERGLLMPDQFLPVAEETGLIVPIGNWALMEACRQIAEWRAELLGSESLVMTVNLSVRQLLIPSFGSVVREALESAGIPGEALRLEITETVFLDDPAAVRETLAQIAELDVKLCLDDFGTGYSSLSYLRDLPVHLLKIDRSFMGRLSEADMGTTGEMVETILTLARGLDLEAVAEGVETEIQRANLLRMGCRHAQGYLFSRPVEAERARALVLDSSEAGIPGPA